MELESNLLPDAGPVDCKIQDSSLEPGFDIDVVQDYGYSDFPSATQAKDSSISDLHQLEHTMSGTNDDSEKLSNTSSCDSTPWSAASSYSTSVSTASPQKQAIERSKALQEAVFQYELPELDTSVSDQFLLLLLSLHTDKRTLLQVVLEPFRYVVSLSSKGFREKFIDGLNVWLQVPPDDLQKIKDIVGSLHNSSLL